MPSRRVCRPHRARHDDVRLDGPRSRVPRCWCQRRRGAAECHPACRGGRRSLNERRGSHKQRHSIERSACVGWSGPVHVRATAWQFLIANVQQHLLHLLIRRECLAASRGAPQRLACRCCSCLCCGRRGREGGRPRFGACASERASGTGEDVPAPDEWHGRAAAARMRPTALARACSRCSRCVRRLC